MAAEHWYNEKQAPVVGASEMKMMARNRFNISYLGISSSTRGASETLVGGGVGKVMVLGPAGDSPPSSSSLPVLPLAPTRRPWCGRVKASAPRRD